MEFTFAIKFLEISEFPSFPRILLKQPGEIIDEA